MMAISRRLKVLDLLLLMGFILPLSLCVGELVTPALADFLDHCPKDCNCKWANGKREADCTRVGFTAVPTHLDHEIQILRMTHNYVRVLGKEVFEQSGLVNLQRIFMNHCHVQEIHWAAFRNLRILVELDLSYNNLTHLQPETFAGNERLQTLTLSHNKIAALSPYVFPYIKHLKSIDLSHNYIEDIQRNTFENLGNSVESLNVDNNRLSTLREEVFLPLTNLKSLQLHSNPWNCDCHLKNFRDWVVFRGLYTYPTSCAEPERLADKLWQDVDPKDFACKPDIQVPQSVVFSQPGANVTLSCFIIGNPMPDAKWVLKGRIVNNNTVPSGGPVSPPQVEDKEGRTTSVSSTLSSTVVTTPWSMSSPSASSENLHQNNSAREYKVGPTQFLIHEEGGLERWFNLTITNVGLESVADYTCVAVNAGGVMEEAITLTFEEPEPVGLPGGKKESQESNIGVIVGAAAGGIFFAFVLLFLLLCCCCCRRRVKKSTGSSLGVSQSSTSNSSSQGGACGPEVERHGSIVGFADSSQKLLPSSSSPMQRGGPHHHQRYAKAFASASITSPELKSSASQSSRFYGMVGSGSRDETTLDYRAFPAPPPPAAAQCDMEILSSSSSATLAGGSSEKTQNYVELQPVVRSPTGAPRKTLTMVTSSTGESFIPDYPDLLNIQQQPSASNFKPQTPHSPKSQPLNPAALVIPPTPPAQFPHQFQHLIHTKPKNSHVLVSPLLSPPAQFSSETNENKSRGYVTLPRKLTASSTSSSRGPIDWSTMSDRPPIYDGVGPRTSATGGTQRPILPDLEAQPKRSASLKRFPAPASAASSNGEKRDSSGSEVTLGGDDSLTAYIEPFGKAMPPLTSNNHKNTCNTTSLRPRPDSIASAVDSDLEAIVCGDGPFATASKTSNAPRRKSCPVHKSGGGPKIIAIPADHSSPPQIQVSKAPKLKGILKASCKSNITTNPFGNSVASSAAASESNATSGASDSVPMPLTDAVHISKSSSIPKPPQRTSSSMNSKNVSEALHV